MPRRVVRQPNGLLALFSTIVDDFVWCHMTEREVFSECHREMGVLEALLKVRRGAQDLDPYTDEKGNGLSRWRECLSTIGAVHGQAIAREREVEMSRPVEAP